jgi:arylsulfatase A-like enzyme
MYPFEHGVILSRRYTLEPAHVTLPEVLAEKGYRTGFFSANPLFAYTLGKGESWSPGFEQGFHDFKVFNRFFNDAMRAPELSEQVSRWIIERRGGRPFFAYVHYVEPHVPYEPPEGFRERYPDSYDGEIDGSTEQMHEITIQATRVPETARRHLINLYDAEIASADAAISEMLIALEEKGLLDNAIVIITADHGEAFYEHGMWQHTTGLYEEFVHVPLVVIPPRSAYQQALATNNEIVGLVDLMPTILDYVGLRDDERPRSMRGSSLRPLLEGRRPGPEIEYVKRERRDTVAQIDIGRPPEPLISGRITVALMTPRFKLIESRLPDKESEIFLFDLQSDPEEQHTLAQDGEHEQQLRALRTRLGEIASRPELIFPIVLPENLRERLRALGYL